MDGVKSLLTSKTIWGALVAVLGGITSLFGYTVSPADMTAVVDTVGQVVGIGGALYAIYGRVVASKKIG